VTILKMPWLYSGQIGKPEEQEEEGDYDIIKNVYYVQYGRLRFGRWSLTGV
jgi:hypothetical protein